MNDSVTSTANRMDELIDQRNELLAVLTELNDTKSREFMKLYQDIEVYCIFCGETIAFHVTWTHTTDTDCRIATPHINSNKPRD